REIEVFIQRLVFLFMVANLANVLAEALREQSEKSRRTAEHLTEANNKALLAHEAVRSSDKLAALVKPTAGLAQDLVNPISTITAAERDAPGIAFYRNYAPEIPPFKFDAELMERVFYNLVLNAAQATAGGGAVTVKTRAEGRVAEIAVIDRGVGIEPAQMKDI